MKKITKKKHHKQPPERVTSILPPISVLSNEYLVYAKTRTACGEVFDETYLKLQFRIGGTHCCPNCQKNIVDYYKEFLPATLWTPEKIKILSMFPELLCQFEFSMQMLIHAFDNDHLEFDLLIKIAAAKIRKGDLDLLRLFYLCCSKHPFGLQLLESLLKNKPLSALIRKKLSYLSPIHLELIEQLNRFNNTSSWSALIKQASLNVPGEHLDALLLWAFQLEHKELVLEMLALPNISITVKDYRVHPIYLAIEYNWPDVITAILKIDPNLAFVELQKYTSAMRKVRIEDRWSCIEPFLNFNFDEAVNAFYSHQLGCTLNRAIVVKEFNIARRILDKNPNLDCELDGYFPIHHAIHHDAWDIVERILEINPSCFYQKSKTEGMVLPIELIYDRRQWHAFKSLLKLKTSPEEIHQITFVCFVIIKTCFQQGNLQGLQGILDGLLHLYLFNNHEIITAHKDNLIAELVGSKSDIPNFESVIKTLLQHPFFLYSFKDNLNDFASLLDDKTTSKECHSMILQFKTCTRFLKILSNETMLIDEYYMEIARFLSENKNLKNNHFLKYYLLENQELKHMVLKLFHIKFDPNTLFLIVPQRLTYQNFKMDLVQCNIQFYTLPNHAKKTFRYDIYEAFRKLLDGTQSSSEQIEMCLEMLKQPFLKQKLPISIFVEPDYCSKIRAVIDTLKKHHLVKTLSN